MADLTFFPLELHIFVCVTLLIEANLPSGSRHSGFHHISLYSASSVVNVVALAKRVHKFGRGATEGALKGGVCLFDC